MRSREINCEKEKQAASAKICPARTASFADRLGWTMLIRGRDHCDDLAPHGDDGGRGEEKVIAGDAVDAALHGIDQQAALQGGGADSSGEILLGREGALARFCRRRIRWPRAGRCHGRRLRCLVAQSLQRLLELCGGSAGAAGVGGFDQFLASADGAGRRVRQRARWDARCR